MRASLLNFFILYLYFRYKDIAKPLTMYRKKRNSAIVIYQQWEPAERKYPRIARCCIENTIEKGATSVVFFVAVLPLALPKHKLQPNL